MKRAGPLVALLLGLALAVPVLPAAALDIEVRRIDRALRNSYQSASPQDARAMLAGYTVLTKALNMGNVRSVVPFSGVAVFYFAPNGTVLAWSQKSNRVEAGLWELSGSHNDVCMVFPVGKGRGVCTDLAADSSWIKESVKGNPFGLKAGAPVPLRMGHMGVSLGKLAGALP